MPPPRVQRYAEQIAAERGLLASAILSNSRKRPIAWARGELMRRLRKDGFTTHQIGRWLGRDHSVVLYWLHHRQSLKEVDNLVGRPVENAECASAFIAVRSSGGA
jgi:chromosomal replication initiation ATPase DnaA